MTVGDVASHLEAIASTSQAFSFDRVGLQLGDPGREVSRAVVSLDRSLGAIRECTDRDAQLLVSHHPLIFQPLGEVTTQDHVGKSVITLLESKIAFIAAHTNWDVAVGGVNDALADLLELQDIVPFGDSIEEEQFKLVVFCPAGDVQRVIDAAAGAGAGTIGNYSRCAFQGMGVGTFRPEEGSNPTIGKRGQIESVDEARIEMIVPTGVLHQVDRAVRNAHSYEEPAMDYIMLRPRTVATLGRKGHLNKKLQLREFAQVVDEKLGTRCWSWGSPETIVQTVGVVGGAADGQWAKAQCDVFLTGEVRQHVALEAAESGTAVIAAGHYATEQPGVRRLAQRLKFAMPEVEWIVYEPQSGEAGRPF